LAESMRPSSLEDYFGQDEVAGKQGFWRSLIQV
jgi:replication-associated recombination protein RarA